MREFNVTGTCILEENYMVDITNKLEQIRMLVDKKRYFTINRGRQYGKTTTLSRLRPFLADEYTVVSLSFEGFDEEEFANAAIFSQKLIGRIVDALLLTNEPEEYRESWENSEVTDFDSLGRHITNMCEGRKIVLMIDEVDKASNHRVFLGFLNKLREKFLQRREGIGATFHSVILAGVYDIKNIKRKLVQEGKHIPSTMESKMYNSPWNIAVAFKVDLSFNVLEISGMLMDYEQDHQTGMDVLEIAEEIYFYTQGYPVLVSKICQYMDEELEVWTVDAVREAVRLLVREIDNELFKSLSQNLETNEDVSKLIYDVLLLGERRSFVTDNPAVDLAYRYGYIRDDNERIKISNRIFEIRMANYFISKDEGNAAKLPSGSFISEVTKNDRFDMQLCLERFLVYWQEIYDDKNAKFFEKECRMLFLMFLKPLLNGVGFYHIESAFTDNRRMDLVITYGKERFVLELKTWKGAVYHDTGVEQLLGYMEKLGEEKGYLLTFDFRQKGANKANWINLDGKDIFEVQV